MYKDKEKDKEWHRNKMRERRSVTPKSVTPENVTPVLLERPNGEPYNPDEVLEDGSKRYLGPFSDGQVLDRLSVKQRLPSYLGETFRASMSACNFSDLMSSRDWRESVGLPVRT